MDQLKSLGYLSGFSPREVELNGKGVDPKDRIATFELLRPCLARLAPHPGCAPYRIAPADADAGSHQSLLYFYLGAEYEKAGHYDQAIQVYENAQKRGILNGRLLSRLGDLLVRSGKKDQAIEAYEKAAQFNPADAESEINLATAYLEQGKLADADRCFRWALANGRVRAGIQRPGAGRDSAPGSRAPPARTSNAPWRSIPTWWKRN